MNRERESRETGPVGDDLLLCEDGVFLGQTGLDLLPGDFKVDKTDSKEWEIDMPDPDAAIREALEIINAK